MLSFSLHDEVEGRPIAPENVDLLTLHQFMGEVMESKTRLPIKEINEAELQALWQKGKVAWAGVPNATEWVEDLRHS